jgi:hypothetical protein
MNSTLSEHTQGEELEVTLGQKAREGTPADGRKNDRAEVRWQQQKASRTAEISPQAKLTLQLGAICDPYTPFASPPRTMPDIGNLSFSDNGSLKGEQLVSYRLLSDTWRVRQLTCEPAPVVTPPLGLPSFTLGESSLSRRHSRVEVHCASREKLTARLGRTHTRPFEQFALLHLVPLGLGAFHFLPLYSVHACARQSLWYQDDSGDFLLSFRTVRFLARVCQE